VPTGGIAVAQADGGGARQLTTERLSPGIAWSPDGAYLLARAADFNASGLRLVRVADGTSLPVRLGVDLFQPSWR
jgi:hypothetical protein